MIKRISTRNLSDIEVHQSDFIEIKKVYKSRDLNKEYKFKTLKKFSHNLEFDFFISHSFQDQETIEKLMKLFDNNGFKTYTDWNDNQLDRSNVTKGTALILKERLNCSKGLIYAYSTSSKVSKWVNWELGLADGGNKYVFVLPIGDIDNDEDFTGEEFLQIYDQIVISYDNSLLQATDGTNVRLLNNWLDYY